MREEKRNWGGTVRRKPEETRNEREFNKLLGKRNWFKSKKKNENENE